MSLAFGPLNSRRFCNSSVFLPHPSSAGVSGLLVVVLVLEFGPREYWGSEPVGTKSERSRRRRSKNRTLAKAQLAEILPTEGFEPFLYIPNA
jgi:hypothetical protein